MARPFLKWPGGKTKLVSTLLELAPKEFNSYHEPFLGAGSFFFKLEEVYGKSITYFLNDLNRDVIGAFACAKDWQDGLLNLELCRLALNNSKEHFYRVRNAFNEFPKDYYSINNVARLIYLNRTCFNGLFRVNSKGHFNVPYGHYKNPEITMQERLEEASEALQRTNPTLSSLDFVEALDKAARGSFVYIDPPYEPLLDKSSFTAYTKEGFNRKDQLRLASKLSELDKEGVKWMLSNSDTPFIRELYKEYNIYEVKVTRTVARTAREVVSELIVRNYLD